MTKTAHTPGPWSHSPLGNTQYHSIDAPEWEVLAKVNTLMVGDSERDREGVANAQLMAAAPEMLTALQHTLDGLWQAQGYLSGLPDSKGERIVAKLKQCAGEAQAAIQKARG